MNITGPFCIINGKLTSVCAFCESEIINHYSIYEVIRIYNRKGAFVTAHLCRMERSAVLIGISMPKTETIFKAMNVLIALKIVSVFGMEIPISTADRSILQR
ncbi:MAG: hypothetical protein R6U85_06155 [Salinivirgaceae bacterium]